MDDFESMSSITLSTPAPFEDSTKSRFACYDLFTATNVSSLCSYPPSSGHIVTRHAGPTTAVSLMQVLFTGIACSLPHNWGQKCRQHCIVDVHPQLLPAGGINRSSNDKSGFLWKWIKSLFDNVSLINIRCQFIYFMNFQKKYLGRKQGSIRRNGSSYFRQSNSTNLVPHIVLVVV